jgi:hypothetical protein
MTMADAEAVFAGYAKAFTEMDVDEVCARWSYPAFMAGRGKQASLDEAAFRQNAVALCAFYSAQGVARAEKQVLELARLTETTSTVRTADTLFDARGDLVAAWEHVYLLTETPAGVRVAVALPDGELAAWRSRGTPLGSW